MQAGDGALIARAAKRRLLRFAHPSGSFLPRMPGLSHPADSGPSHAPIAYDVPALPCKFPLRLRQPRRPESNSLPRPALQTGQSDPHA